MPAIYGHPDTEEYEACNLTIDQWKDVIKKAEDLRSQTFSLHFTIVCKSTMPNGSPTTEKHVHGTENGLTAPAHLCGGRKKVDGQVPTQQLKRSGCCH